MLVNAPSNGLNVHNNPFVWIQLNYAQPEGELCPMNMDKIRVKVLNSPVQKVVCMC